MKILFVPVGGKSHQIPLYVLYKRYFSKRKDIISTFILPGSDHKIFKDQNINVLDFDYTIPSVFDKSFILKTLTILFKREEEIIKTYCPDIIIESLAVQTAVICARYEIPRISIQRTGLFRSSDPLTRNSNHSHSFEKHQVTGQKKKAMLFKEPDSQNTDYIDFTNEAYFLGQLIGNNSFVKAKTKLIPAISRIEKLPPIKNVESYFYCGPLNAKDNPTKLLKERLIEFFELNTKREKVFVTTGLVEKQDISEIISFLLQKGYAVVSTVPYQNPNVKHSRLFFNSTLPLNLVCSAVDLVVHHCGSGMYHYPLLNMKPTITIGTQCYDREEVALQLEALGISAHTPSPQDDPQYLEVFKAHVERFEKGSLCDFDKLEKIREEIIDTMLSFDVEKVINYTLDL